jgi:biotin-(acetyl-CoA carboxylase) ligase
MIAIGNVFKVIKSYLDEAKTQSITKIKWINDIMVDFEKVSGVLIKNEMIGQAFYT